MSRTCQTCGYTEHYGTHSCAEELKKEIATLQKEKEEWRQTVQAYTDSYDAAWKETITTLFNRGITEVPLSDLQVDHLNKLQSLRDLLTNRRSASNG